MNKTKQTSMRGISPPVSSNTNGTSHSKKRRQSKIGVDPSPTVPKRKKSTTKSSLTKATTMVPPVVPPITTANLPPKADSPSMIYTYSAFITFESEYLLYLKIIMAV